MSRFNKIIRNSAMCDVCHEEIESKDRHDFKWCSCRNLAVDGGKDYCKRSFGNGPWHDTSITEEIIPLDRKDG